MTPPAPVGRGPAPSLLAAQPIFAAAGRERLALLERSLEERRLPAGATIFRRGDAGDAVYLIASGGATILHDVVGEPVERVRDLAENEIFGEMEVLEGTRRMFSARTWLPTVLQRLAAEPFLAFLGANPPVEMSLRALVIQRRTSRLRAVLAPATRREPRIRVDLAVWLALPEGRSYRAHLEDLSPGGACLSGVPAAWSEGAEVAFTLGIDRRPDLLPVAASVRWRRSDAAGLAFHIPDRRRVELALAELLAAPR
jgi:CRP-like cAMP-binding protein